MKTGPTQKTMKKLIAASCDGRPAPAMPIEEAIGYTAPAAPLLTDWIPCTTPPVRDGEYDLTMFPNDEGGDIKISYRNGKWSGDGVNISPGEFHWRGVRRWVLTVRDFLNGERTYVAHVSQRGVLYLTDNLVEPYSSSYKYKAALNFETEADAVAYATKHKRRLNGYKAVLA